MSPKQPYELWNQANEENPGDPDGRRKRYHDLMVGAGFIVKDKNAPDPEADPADQAVVALVKLQNALHSMQFVKPDGTTTAADMAAHHLDALAKVVGTWDAHRQERTAAGLGQPIRVQGTDITYGPPNLHFG